MQCERTWGPAPEQSRIDRPSTLFDANSVNTVGEDAVARRTWACERHRASDTKTSKAGTPRERRDREQCRYQHRKATECVEIEQQPSIGHPCMPPHLRCHIDLCVEAVKEPSFGRECADCDNSLEEFAEVWEDWWTGVGLHSAKIPAGVEVSDGELPIGESNHDCREKESREDNTAPDVEHANGEVPLKSRTRWSRWQRRNWRATS